MAKGKVSAQPAVKNVETASLKLPAIALRNNASAVEPVSKSIAAFGFNQPIVADSDLTVIVGATRLLAARKLGMTHVPVLIAKHLSPEQARAYRIADNQLGSIATFDHDKLVQEILALSEFDVDLTALGFDQDEMARMLNTGANARPAVDPDDIPEPPSESSVRIGDLYIMGKNRLVCGDSGNAAHVDLLMGGERAHLVNTDPPYGVGVEARSNNAINAGLSTFSNQKPHKGHHQGFDEARRGGKLKSTHKQLRPKDRVLLGDFLSDEDFQKKLMLWFGSIARVLLPGHAFYIWGGYANIANYPPALAANGLKFSQSIIWNKLHPVLTRKDFMGAHEQCFYGWKEGASHRFFGPKNVPDLWEIKKVPPMEMTHLTEKACELAMRAMRYSSKAGENVVDLFGGGGWTMIAAEQLERRAFLCELDCHYASQIINRWEKFTGLKAKLEHRDNEVPSQATKQHVAPERSRKSKVQPAAKRRRTSAMVSRSRRVSVKANAEI